MSMTADVSLINKITSLGIGKVFINNKGYIPSRAEGALFDLETYNFHLYPSEDELLEEDKIYIYEKDFSKVRKDLLEYLNNEENVTIVTSEKDFREKLTERDGKIYFSENAGKSGILNTLKRTKKFNSYFRYIKCCKNGNVFYINFSRLYIDKEKKINCIYGKYQFNCEIAKNIKYPTSYKGQNIELWKKRINQHNELADCYYNPQTKWDCIDYLELKNDKYKEKAKEEVINAFFEFVDAFSDMIKKN